MINLIEKLKGCPKWTPLYTPLYGEVYLFRIDEDDKYPIEVSLMDGNCDEIRSFTSDGKWVEDIGECLLFPSKDNRDWNEFRLPINTFKPFDKVLVRDDMNNKWLLNLFAYYDGEDKYYPYVCINGRYGHCIPYEGNEHLLGTPSTPKDY